MGQLTLGIKNLTIKLAVFFVMAALLAWALGGTLWPKAERFDYPAVSFNNQMWFWQMELGGREDGPPRYRMMQQTADQRKPTNAVEQVWHQVAGPIVCDAGLVFAGCNVTAPDGDWQVLCIAADGQRQSIDVIDRIGVETLFLQLRQGAPFEFAP